MHELSTVKVIKIQNILLEIKFLYGDAFQKAFYFKVYESLSRNVSSMRKHTKII